MKAVTVTVWRAWNRLVLEPSHDVPSGWITASLTLAMVMHQSCIRSVRISGVRADEPMV
jgi:hypothetical protein